MSPGTEQTAVGVSVTIQQAALQLTSCKETQAPIPRAIEAVKNNSYTFSNHDLLY